MTTATTNTVSCQTRMYRRSESAVFLKTKEKHGGLSNMAGGFPLVINGVAIRTSEALYQACRFPHLPELQRDIVAQKSPMTAKMKGKPYRHISRPDWDAVRVKIMRWCLQVKLAQNWDNFSELLLETGDIPIVEHSRRDDFWGAKPINGETLVGTNALGRLLMELRERVKDEPREDLQYVTPLPIPEFLLYERPIEPIGCRTSYAIWNQVALEIEDQEEIFSEPTQVPADTSPSSRVADTLGNYVLFDADCPSTNINTATVSELARVKLPGIGEKIAQRIVDYRDENGPFQSEEDLIAVPGIGPKTIEKITTKITV